MSRKFETVQVPASTREQLAERLCDFCGRKARNSEWSDSTYDVNNTAVTMSIKHESGESYPSGGRTVERSVDMCPACFESKLVPWLHAQGVEVHEHEFDW